MQAVVENELPKKDPEQIPERQTSVILGSLLQAHPPNCPVQHRPLKTVLCFLFLVCGGLASSFSLILTNQRLPEVEPLKDMLLDNLPYVEEGLIACEIIMLVSLVFSFLIIILHNCTLIILRRVFFIAGLLYSYRSITMALTVLPSPNTMLTCSKIPEEEFSSETVFKNGFKLFFGGWLSLWARHKLCGDYIFSGYTMCLVLAWKVVKEYGPKVMVMLHWISLILAMTGVFLLLVGRVSYTLDVIIGYWITTRVWWVYHTLANHPTTRINNKHNCLMMFWWARVVVWLEEGVVGPLPDTFRVPLPNTARKSFLGRSLGCWRKGEDDDTSSDSDNSF